MYLGISVAVIVCFAASATMAVSPLPANMVTLDASALALPNLNVVSAWGGQTAAGTPTFLTNQTNNGGPAVEFNGGGDRMGNDIPLSPSAAQDWIVVAVIKPQNIGAYHNLVDDEVQNGPMLWIDPSFQYELNFSGGTGARVAGTGPGGWDIVIADSRLNQLYVNSPVPNASGGAAFAFAAGETFDFFHRDSNQTFHGLVAELRVYNDRAAFGSNFAALYDEMRLKWFGPDPFNPPPQITSIVASPPSIFPANRRMVRVTLTITATDDSGLPATCVIDSVVPSNGPFGVGPDFTLIGPLVVDLRAERPSGGTTRTYTITVKCTDGNGAFSTAQKVVEVTGVR